jgi:hypothetical protein
VQASVKDTPETAGKPPQKLPVAEGQRLAVTLTADDTSGSQKHYKLCNERAGKHQFRFGLEVMQNNSEERR